MNISLLQNEIKMKNLIVVFFFIISFFCANAQIIERPNFGEKSHQTLTILKIELTDSYTKICFSVENKSDKGDWFCADKNISLVNSLGNEKYKLIKSENIPTCPQTYKFTFAGESLLFSLFFPKINPALKTIDIVEECNNACFTFRGVILDQNLNNEINMGYNRYSKGKLDLAAVCFANVINNYKTYNYGFPYYVLTKIYAEKNDFAQSKNWYEQLKKSNVKDKANLLKLIESESFFPKLNIK